MTTQCNIESSITLEFEELQKMNIEYSPCPVAQQQCNSGKNRYFDIVPTEQSRVRLSCSQDYINASHIKMDVFPETSGYIACQAPLNATIDDFWRMVWEQSSGVIVMLTSLREKNVEKVSPSRHITFHFLKNAVRSVLARAK